MQLADLPIVKKAREIFKQDPTSFSPEDLQELNRMLEIGNISTRLAIGDQARNCNRNDWAVKAYCLVLLELFNRLEVDILQKVLRKYPNKEAWTSCLEELTQEDHLKGLLQDNYLDLYLDLDKDSLTKLIKSEEENKELVGIVQKKTLEAWARSPNHKHRQKYTEWLNVLEGAEPTPQMLQSLFSLGNNQEAITAAISSFFNFLSSEKIALFEKTHVLKTLIQYSETDYQIFGESFTSPAALAVALRQMTGISEMRVDESAYINLFVMFSEVAKSLNPDDLICDKFKSIISYFVTQLQNENVFYVNPPQKASYGDQSELECVNKREYFRENVGRFKQEDASVNSGSDRVSFYGVKEKIQSLIGEANNVRYEGSNKVPPLQNPISFVAALEPRPASSVAAVEMSRKPAASSCMIL
jgi:hypothetical protein